MTHVPVRLQHRPGFTLIEMMMAVVLTMLVFGMTIPFFRMQTNAVDVGAGRLDALQNARFAQAAIDRELRIAGGITGQPIIVQADNFSVSFNVNLVTRLNGNTDADATYYNPNADPLSTEAWDSTRAKSLPLVTKKYPTANYYDANGNLSGAETISYFARVDPTAGRSDLYILYRRVNDRDSTIVVRNLLIPIDTAYLFRYYKASASGVLSQIPTALLPLYWDSASRLQDSIWSVDMRLSSLYRDVKKAQDVTRTIYHRSRLQNAGKLLLNTCGNPPAAPGSVTATQVLDVSGNVQKIRVTWTASSDELSGEADVGLYLVQRKTGSGQWSGLSNVSAGGAASYTYDDFAFVSGTWTYGVYAQDCSPANSATTAAGSTVTNP
jgi:prepilin-type N-terminal cleavage/methylation domain-containing protein